MANEVQIGTQVWMTKNLNVSRYRNGDVIPEVNSPTEWANLTTGAWCYYNNESVNGRIYGKLYNWYAVNDARGLAPVGWHIPNDEEWSILTVFLGGVSNSGKLKATILWDSPNTAATNSTGFTALPAGTLSLSQTTGQWTFFNLQKACYFWCVTEISANASWSRGMAYNSSTIFRNQGNKTIGSSVRLIKD